MDTFKTVAKKSVCSHHDIVLGTSETDFWEIISVSFQMPPFHSREEVKKQISISERQTMFGYVWVNTTDAIWQMIFCPFRILAHQLFSVFSSLF